MAFTTISVTNGIEIKKVPLGFSWTTLFFAGWPAVLRGDWILGLVVIVLSMFTWGLAGIIFAFMYNTMYAKALFNKGYTVHAIPPDVTAEQVQNHLGLLTLPGCD